MKLIILLSVAGFIFSQVDATQVAINKAQNERIEKMNQFIDSQS